MNRRSFLSLAAALPALSAIGQTASAPDFAKLPVGGMDKKLAPAFAAAGYGYLELFITAEIVPGKEDAAFILSDIWRNPKEAIRGVDGIIVPKGFNPFVDSAWCVVVSYEKCGYVKDDDAAEIDAKKLLTAFHEHEEEVNEEYDEEDEEEES